MYSSKTAFVAKKEKEKKKKKHKRPQPHHAIYLIA
jgi:hypothetical protein